MKNKVLSTVRQLLMPLLKREGNDVFQRQKLIVFLSCVVLTLVLVPCHFIGMVGASDLVLKLLSVLMITTSVTMLVLVLTGRLTVSKALGIQGIVFVVFLSVKIVYIALALPNMTYLIPVNEFIVVMAITIVAMCHIRHVPFIMCGLFIVVLTIGNIFVKTKSLDDFNFIFIGFILFLCLLGPTMIYNVDKMRRDNERFKKDEEALISVVRMNHKEIYNYIAMSRNSEPTEKEVDHFFSILSEKAKRNIIRAVEMKIAGENANTERLKRTFPMFTPSEIAVVSLILQGKRLSEICNLTGKSENNINTVRSHIRKKLALNPNEDLREALMMKI